jgi:hypothetical protein
MASIRAFTAPGLLSMAPENLKIVGNKKWLLIFNVAVIFSSKYFHLLFVKNIYEFCGHKPFYSISVIGVFLGTSLPPTPNWSRFDLYICFSNVFNWISNYTLYFNYCVFTCCKIGHEVLLLL